MDFGLIKYVVLSLCMVVAGIQIKHYHLCYIAFAFAYIIPKLHRDTRGESAAILIFVCVLVSTWRYMVAP